MFALMPCGFLHLLDLLAKMADQRLQAFPSHRGNREHVEPLLAAVGLEVLPRFTTLAGGVKLGGCDRVRFLGEHRIVLFQLAAASVSGQIIGEVRDAVDQRDFKHADALIADYRASHGVTPEMLEAISWMGRGALAAKDALTALGTGLYVGNLHYLNYSDRPAARITGMTRFATFWVEGGEIVAPIDVLRFDDTLFRMLGKNLEALTAETEFLLASDCYGSRQLSSMRVPGALLSEMTFTL